MNATVEKRLSQFGFKLIHPGDQMPENQSLVFPDLVKPGMENPAPENPGLEIPTQINTEESNTEELKTDTPSKTSPKIFECYCDFVHEKRARMSPWVFGTVTSLPRLPRRFAPILLPVERRFRAVERVLLAVG